MNYEYNDLLDQPIDDESTSEPEKDPEFDLYEENDLLDMHLDDEPKFKVGDIVKADDVLYVISDTMYVEYVKDNRIYSNYSYECTPLDSINDVAETYHVLSESSQYKLIDESALIFQYHDKQWEEYFAESVRNGLPAWRGKLYNFYMFYNNFESHTGLDYKYMEEYNDDTIPPMFMRHILAEHSIYCRIDKVLESPENVRKIEKRLNIDKYDMEKLINSIKSKINTRNFRGTDKASINVKPNKFDFTGDEMNLVAEIDKLDVVVKNGQRLIEDHYPIDMSNWQIMDAIKEAYLNASKTSGIIMQGVRDRRGDTEYSNTGKQIDPVKGKRTYQGESRKYNLIIEIWYNFDLNLIESAYPLKMNNNAKKH